MIFTSRLHGNRSPFKDLYARGMFFNLSLQTGKRDMIRAVLEGDAYHKRWMLETVEKKVPRNRTLQFVGRGRIYRARILANITGRTIEVTEHAKNTGVTGAALVCGVMLGMMRFEDMLGIVQVANDFAHARSTGRYKTHNTASIE